MARLRRYERMSIENRRFLLKRGQFGPKFQVKESFSTNHVSSHKTRMIVFLVI